MQYSIDLFKLYIESAYLLSIGLHNDHNNCRLEVTLKESSQFVATKNILFFLQKT